MGKKRKNSPVSNSNEITAEAFSKAFIDKVASVRASTSTAPKPIFESHSCIFKFDRFDDVDVLNICELIKKAPNKNCALDPVPTWIIKQFANLLAPFIAALCNASLRSGTFPSTQKCALVTPALKKPNLDPSDLNNYRPISNLSFLSKLLERCVNRQTNDYLSNNNLLPKVQSAYRKSHSTESAVLKVTSDVYAAADRGKVTLLALLDMSAAFDTVDHEILLDRLLHDFGFEGRAHDWFRSYITGRSQCINYNGTKSDPVLLNCGVPQGSVLGPVLFLIYSAETVAIAEKHGFSAHSYADDLQIYDHTDQNSCPQLVQRLSGCIVEINEWMASNRLRLNPTKTELIWLASPHRLIYCPKEPQDVAGVQITPSSKVRDLGVMIDEDLSLISHVKHLARTCYYQIRQIHTIRRTLSVDTAHALVRALVHSRLDYCNGVLAKMPQCHLDRLQSVLRSAARLVLRLPSSANVTELMRRTLHWLPINERINYKLCLFAYKCQHELAPIYLSEMLTPVANLPYRSHLRGAARGDLEVPLTRTVTIGPRGFSFACPSAWNTLPNSLKDKSLTLFSFKKQLKTVLFSR